MWAAVVIGLEELRRRVGGIWAYLLGAVQLLMLYALAIRHHTGNLSWTTYYQSPLLVSLYAHMPWLFDVSPVGLFSNIALILLRAARDRVRSALPQVQDGKAHALLETTAEVLQGLMTAFEDFEEGTENGWR
jgi:hypothetical protein